MISQGLPLESTPAPLWRVAPVEDAQVRALAEALGVAQGLAGVYLRRGLDTLEKVAAFCRPDADALHSAWLLPDMRAAVARLCHALDAGETVHVHGDYDVDGVTATAVVVYTLRKLGANVTWHVPHRVRDGYGLTVAAVERAQANGATLLLSVDCGTDARDAAKRACELGIDLIVTDHHEPEVGGERLPCVAVINPLRADSVYPFHGLSGVGVAYKTMMALCERRHASLAHVEDRLLEFVAMGTVVDMAPLEGENRTLAQMGMARMRRTQKAGMRALLQACNVLAPDLLTSATLGYQLGPRLNAPGRIDDARYALDLLLARQEEDAQALCRRLNEINAQRKALQAQIQQEALALLAEKGVAFKPGEAAVEFTSRLALEGALQVRGEASEHEAAQAGEPEGAQADAQVAALCPGLVAVGASGWPPGLTGSVASFLADTFGRPALLAILHPDGTASGSCRSYDGFPILQALKSETCAGLLTRCGGHAFACGFALPVENLPALIERLNALAVVYQAEHARKANAAGLVPGQKIVQFDGEFRCEDVSLDTLRGLARLSPFRADGAEPLLLFRNVQIVDAQTVKKGEHLKLTLRGADSLQTVSAIAWNRGADAGAYPVGTRADIAAHLGCETYGGRLAPQLVVQDIRPSSNSS